MAEEDQGRLPEEEMASAVAVEGVADLLGLRVLEALAGHAALARAYPSQEGRFSSHHCRYASIVSNTRNGASSSTDLYVWMNA